MFIDRRFDLTLLIVGRIVEVRLEPAGYGNARIVDAPHEKPKGLLVVQTNTHLAMQLADDLNYLRGIAHRGILPVRPDQAMAIRIRLVVVALPNGTPAMATMVWPL